MHTMFQNDCPWKPLTQIRGNMPHECWKKRGYGSLRNYVVVGQELPETFQRAVFKMNFKGSFFGSAWVTTIICWNSLHAMEGSLIWMDHCTVRLRARIRCCELSFKPFAHVFRTTGWRTWFVFHRHGSCRFSLMKNLVKATFLLLDRRVRLRSWLWWTLRRHFSCIVIRLIRQDGWNGWWLRTSCGHSVI